MEKEKRAVVWREEHPRTPQSGISRFFWVEFRCIRRGLELLGDVSLRNPYFVLTGVGVIC